MSKTRKYTIRSILGNRKEIYVENRPAYCLGGFCLRKRLFLAAKCRGAQARDCCNKKISRALRQGLNAAVAHIEAGLTGETDLSGAARLAGPRVDGFARFFSYSDWIAGKAEKVQKAQSFAGRDLRGVPLSARRRGLGGVPRMFGEIFDDWLTAEGGGGAVAVG